MSKEEDYTGKHRDSREIRRERGKQIIVTYENKEQGRYKGTLDKREKK